MGRTKELFFNERVRYELHIKDYYKNYSIRVMEFENEEARNAYEIKIMQEDGEKITGEKQLIIK
jgi:hypothetical protein|tara:strand:- start:5903 stop:6094 length:192 start_codon:yes stop_codon:yes gene_type:complete